MNNEKDIIERIDEFKISSWINFLSDIGDGEYEACYQISDETLLEDCKKEILRQRYIIDNLLKNIGE